jgi:CRISPR-associated endonuclease/helicase Cas3
MNPSNPPEEFYAHSHPDFPNDSSKWEPLFTPFGEGENECQREHCEKCRNLAPYHGHLNKVAWWTARFASKMFSPGSVDAKSAWEWGYLTGLWHDLGKYSREFQERLKGAPLPVDHSTAGARHTAKCYPFGSLVSYLIAGHHAGLADGSRLFFGERANIEIPDWFANAQTSGIPLDLTLPNPPLTRPNAGNDAMAFILRFFFSCLVDADFLATEAFMNQSQAKLRTDWPDSIISKMLPILENHLTAKFAHSEDTPVNQARENVRQACFTAALREPGFFSLTVPTGGGKTLSSLLFALRHAHLRNHQRIIYVIPFTSIIRQNADVFRKAFASLSQELGREIVLEHHSKFEPKPSNEDNEQDRHRLASENWDAPIIVTTNVQFFESLFANRTSSCRKLHRIARSVIIFDEAQALPSRLLHPILRSLTSLVKDLGCTAVLCTATQPALDQRDGFTIGIPSQEITPIIQNESALFKTLRRVEPENLGELDDESLISHILQNATNGCLVILNTTKAAQTLHQQLSTHLNSLHLSARMCPAHIIQVLDQAKKLRSQNQPVALVSTQLIEAGVDISFPVVYRAECGLDSFAQAAGRCNRNGELEALGEIGKVYLFAPSDHPIPSGLNDIASAAAITRSQVIPNFSQSNLLDLDAIRTYFEQAIWQAGERTKQWDDLGIVSGGMPCFDPKDCSNNWALAYSFKTAAEKFRLIDSVTHSVFIPWGKGGKALEEEFRSLAKQGRSPNLSHYRRAQQFTIQVYENEWITLKPSLTLLFDESIAILTHPENDYDDCTGLKRANSPANPNAFML